MFVHMQSQAFHHKKQTAQQALNGNQLQQAIELYTEALQIAQTLPHLFPEIPKILSNRSLVYFRQGKFQLALNEADHSINVNRLWIKGYWRAVQAHKELRQVDCALDAAIGGYNVSVSQEQEEEILSFLVEIVSIIITLRYDPKNLLENSEIHPGSIQTQRKLLQRLASNNCWEGVSLLVMGVHAGPTSTLDASAATCSVVNLSVGNLLKNTSILELKRFGVELAVCLLRSGASYEDIEQKMEKPVIHVGLKVALDTGNISLIKLMFSQYLKTAEAKDALDGEGRTGLHVIVHSGKIIDSICETLLRLLISNGCKSSISDRNGKLAIDYLTPNDLGYNILSTTTKVADRHVKVKINETKEKGNTAFKNKEYKEALIFYNRAITMVKGYENLAREAAIVLTNRSIVHSTLHIVTEALKDAEEAVRCDPTWMKGHWKRGQILRQKKLFRESFSAFLEGYWKGGGTASEKCNILVEAVASFSNITEKLDLEAIYKALNKVSCEAWPKVLTRLSARGEWAAIRYLVLGIDFKYINEQVTPRGVAKDTDLQGITYNTLFQYLESHEDPTLLSEWISPLVLFLVTQRGDLGTLLKFRASEEDTTLSAAVRFCVLTGDIALLQNITYRPEMMEFVDGRGDSPFHTLFKMPRCLHGKLLTAIVRLLLQKGVYPTVRDRSQLLPIDYVNSNNNKEVYDMLSKYTQPVEREEQRQKTRKEQDTKGDKREEAERRRQKSEESVRGRQEARKKPRKKEPAKTLDYCESRIEDATKLLEENNVTQAYLHLAEVLKKVHMLEKHKEMEKKALDIVINSLGLSANPEIPNELVKIPHKLYEQIINGLAANEKWRQMYITVKEHRRHYGDLSLPNFAKSMSVAKVIRHSSFQGSEQLLVDIVDCMLKGGAMFDKGKPIWCLLKFVLIDNDQF